MDKYTFDEIQNKILIRLSNNNDKDIDTFKTIDELKKTIPSHYITKDIFFSMELIRDIF